MTNDERRATSDERRATILLVAGALVASACGKIADPQPPITAPAPPLSGLQLIAEGDVGASIEFVAPARLERVQLLRRCAGQAEAEPLANVSAASLRRGITAGARRIDDPGALPEVRCEYRLLYQVGGRPGQSAPQVWEPAAVAQPPVLREPAVAPDGLRLSWEPPDRNTDGSQPARIEGYLVNGTTIVAGTEFVDRDLAWGEERSYRVQTISRMQNPIVLSRPSEPKRITPVDRFPPEPPDNVIAVADGRSVRVVWDPSPSGDVAGYYVYRGTRPDRLQKASPLLSVNRYTDETPPAGSTVYYQVIAVDARGNESGPSEQVHVDRRSN